MRDEMTSFFSAYRDAFSKGPAAIADFYAEPCVTARTGTVRVNATRKQTQVIFADIDRRYRAKGFTHGEMLSLEAKPLGANSVLATVHWAYKGAAGTTLWETTFSYNLYRYERGWKILLQTMHD